MKWEVGPATVPASIGSRGGLPYFDIHYSVFDIGYSINLRLNKLLKGWI